MNGCKHRINAKCTLFSNEWAESRCHIKNEMDCPYHDPVSITNADRIREMDFDALCLLLSDISDGYLAPVDEEICADCKEVSCTPCWELWLRKEIPSQQPYDLLHEEGGWNLQ